MTRFLSRLILAAIPLALVACKGEHPTSGKTAGGEILPGSASDAMLPLDTLRSQPPLAPKTEPADKPDKGKPSDSPTNAVAPGPQPTNSAATIEAPAALPSGE